MKRFRPASRVPLISFGTEALLAALITGGPQAERVTILPAHELKRCWRCRGAWRPCGECGSTGWIPVTLEPEITTNAPNT